MNDYVIFRKISLLFWLTGVVFSLHAQPSTDIWMLELQEKEGKLHANQPRNLTDRDGYDNQPSFGPQSERLFISSIREGGQSDVYQYELESRQWSRLIHTPETSEYSPTVLPNGKHIAVVQVEADGTTQRMWRFKAKDGSKPQLMMDAVQPVGYFTWYRPKEVAMFILGEKFTLQTTQWKKQKLSVQASDIGRSLHTIPGTDKVSYVDKSDSTDWKIMSWDPATGKTEKIVSTLAGSEDYAWTPSGRILMGKDKLLYSFLPGKDKSWQAVGDLGVGNFYRLAVSPDGTKLAVVAFRE
ncbi:MAG: hypothetical protein AAFR61_17650 [Bacteroidota bacterium]